LEAIWQKHPLVLKPESLAKNLRFSEQHFIGALIIELLNKIAYSEEFTWISKYAIILLRVGFVLCLILLCLLLRLRFRLFQDF
jgi:hypothetical protein